MNVGLAHANGIDESKICPLPGAGSNGYCRCEENFFPERPGEAVFADLTTDSRIAFAVGG
jgi:hypothetical protein